MALAEEKRVTVRTITDVKYSIQKSMPPNLVVTAVGVVPTAGYKDVQLSRAVYVQAPADGIQDYSLTAVQPQGSAAAVLTKVEASDTWTDYQKDAPWIKGARIRGVDNGVKVIMFGQ